MHRPVTQRLTVLLAATTAGGLLLFGGCNNAPKQRDADVSPTDTQDTRAEAAAEAEAQRLAEAMARSNTPSGLQVPDPEVLWIDPHAESEAGAANANNAQAVTTPSIELSHQDPTNPAMTAASLPDAATPPAPEADAEPAPEREPMNLASMSRTELLETLLAQVRRGPGTALQKALDEALLTAAEPGRPIDPEALEGLDDAQVEQVARFQSMVQLFRHQLTSAEGRVDRRAVAVALDDLYGSLPLTIRTAELCRRVEGFGVYEPFDSRTFMAGRDNKMIIYLELENFAPVEIGNGQHEVKLAQEVALYTDWDGQKVWRHETQQIVDRSRNQRRDFFVVQMITLPARLSVGKYILKVDVTDLHGGSVDGVPIEINLVADQSLVRDDARATRPDRTQLIRQLLEEDDNQPLRGN